MKQKSKHEKCLGGKMHFCFVRIQGHVLRFDFNNSEMVMKIEKIMDGGSGINIF